MCEWECRSEGLHHPKTVKTEATVAPEESTVRTMQNTELDDYIDPSSKATQRQRLCLLFAQAFPQAISDQEGLNSPLSLTKV